MGGIVKKKKIADKIRKPWERERLVSELELVGKFGLRNKKELRTITALARKDKTQARKLLITTDKDQLMTEGRGILNRLTRLGMVHGVDFNDAEVIKEQLKGILNFGPTDYLKRRLQTIVYEQGITSSIHKARCLIVQNQIVMKDRVVNKPGMLVLSESQGFIGVNPNSATMKAKKGRFAKKYKSKEKEEN